MHTLISKLLQKRGIKNVEDLTPEEKPTFESWQRVLSEKEDLDAEGIKNFCQQQLNEIKGLLRNTENDPLKNERLITMQNVYGTILDAIHAPKIERESLEKYLIGLLD